MSSSSELPRADMAESELIGAVVLDPAMITEYHLDDIPPEAFWQESRRTWWKAVLRLHWSDSPIDMATLVEDVRKHDELDRAGGVSTLMGCMDMTGVGHHAPMYGKQVVDAYERRQAIQVLEQGIGMARSGADFPVIRERVEAGLDKIRRDDSSSLDQAVELAKGYLENENRITTGWPSIDHLIGGLPVGDLTVVAGRTSMGKSAFAHAIAFHVANSHVLTPDQPLPEIIVNETCRRSRIPFDAIKRNVLTDEHKKQWVTSLAQVKQDIRDHVSFDDKSLTLDRMVMEIKRAARLGKKLVVVDHIQRIRGDRYSRRELMIDVTGTLKDMARDHDITVLALSQLSRSIDERDTKVPMLSDLSESKSIEEDANMVLFLYRDKYYDPHSPHGDMADVVLAKDKTGPRMVSSRLFFDSRFVSFREPEAGRGKPPVAA